MTDDAQRWSLHFEGPADTSGIRKGDMVGGPYKTKKRARVALDRADNKYGAYVHRIRPYGAGTDMVQLGEGKPHGGGE